MSENEHIADHEGRLIEVETTVKSLQWHHRNDKVLESIEAIRQDITALELKPINGSLANIETRLRRIEWIVAGATGGFATLEFLTRFIK